MDIKNNLVHPIAWSFKCKKTNFRFDIKSVFDVNYD